MVMIEGKLYDLVPTNETMVSINKLPAEEVPYVRLLNPIRIRSHKEQIKYDEDRDELHNLAKEVKGSGRSQKVTSMAKAVKLGKNVPEEIKRLMEEKEKALEGGDTKKASSIRKVLRKLDYKRYLNKEE